ncbi:hypothetical protein PFNF135_00663 [Plasmodium falciparum NF135/5.C10]|uniref:J domain-containing protein n=1 Tax=Plasmodium falciparum NF135/5.C10 TaxID=1036726 RepID=W4INP8_PLAFA|nr:hypothetical protein PFNF135_00663 [Plasmodium falciparum NF135/5.C10]
MKKNYYEILYVKPDFDINEIKREFYNLSLKYYPKMNKIMKEIMEGQNIREEHLDELLRDRLYLYIDNKDEYEILMDNGIRMLLKSSFSNFILESI